MTCFETFICTILGYESNVEIYLFIYLIAGKNLQVIYLYVE
jgi:hypothetical protein